MPRRIATTNPGPLDAAAEWEAEHELTGLELRSIRPPAVACSPDRRLAFEAYSREFFRELNRLRNEGVLATAIVERMKQFRDEHHPAVLPDPPTSPGRS